MFILQIQRYFPLPNYNLSDKGKVTVKIIGKIIDENYTKLLINNTNLELKTVIALDKVQKKEQLTENERKMLRQEKLIEGKYPNVYVTAKVAAVTDKKAQYIKNRAFDKEYYKNLILEYLKKYGTASRKDLESLLTDKLPDFMDAQQKYRKISSIIKELSQKENKIVNTSGSTRFSNWKLVD